MIERRRRISVNDSYGGVFVYNLSGQILEQYPFEVTDVQKGRGAYICYTDSGRKIMKEYKGSDVRAETLYQLLEQVKEKHFLADQIVTAKENAVLATDVDGVKYYVRNMIDGKECETKNLDDIMNAVSGLAQLHNILQECQVSVPECMKVSADELLMVCEKHNRELKKVRNYIHNKKKKNEFEMIFMNNYQRFLTQAIQSTQALKEQMEKLSKEEWKQMIGICHGDFNQHNVLFTRQGLAVTNFEQLAYDIRIRDLANFMRKIMEKYNWKIGLATDMIGVYEKKRKISSQEMQQLFIRLSYPEKFWKIANHYYNSNKAWVSGRNIEKLNKVIEQEEQREQFLKMLFYFVKD